MKSPELDVKPTCKDVTIAGNSETQLSNPLTPSGQLQLLLFLKECNSLFSMQTLFPQENFSCIVAENIWRTNSLLNSLFIVSFRKPIISHLVVFTKKLNQSYIVTLLIPSFRQPKPYRLLFPVNTWHFSLFPCSVLLPTITQFSFLICYKSVKTINISQWVEMVISVLLLTIHFTSFSFHCIKHPPQPGLLITTESVISTSNYWHSFLVHPQALVCLFRFLFFFFF